jgi:hypothetical protein
MGIHTAEVRRKKEGEMMTASNVAVILEMT